MSKDFESFLTCLDLFFNGRRDSRRLRPLLAKMLLSLTTTMVMINGGVHVDENQEGNTASTASGGVGAEGGDKNEDDDEDGEGRSC